MKTGLIGTKQLGLDALTRLRALTDVSEIITMDDRGDSRSRLPEFVAEGATVATSRMEADEAIRRMSADLVLVAGWYWLISSNELRARQFVGIHHSLLPAYRGGSPLVWALIEGQHVVGTSLFELTENADAGPIWGQAEVAAGDGYIGNVAGRCDAESIKLLPRLFDARSTPVDQDHKNASWRSQRHPDDGLIDWTRSAIEIQRWIRAQSRPYPGAFTYVGDRRAVIWRASASDESRSVPAGTLDRGVVACGDGRGLIIEEASFEIPSDSVLHSPRSEHQQPQAPVP